MIYRRIIGDYLGFNLTSSRDTGIESVQYQLCAEEWDGCAKRISSKKR